MVVADTGRWSERACFLYVWTIVSIERALVAQLDRAQPCEG